MGQQGVSQNEGVLVVLVVECPICVLSDTLGAPQIVQCYLTDAWCADQGPFLYKDVILTV